MNSLDSHVLPTLFGAEYFESIRFGNGVVWQSIVRNFIHPWYTSERSDKLSTAITKDDEFILWADNNEAKQFFNSHNFQSLINEELPISLLSKLLIGGIWIMYDTTFFSSVDKNSGNLPTGDFIAPNTDFQKLIIEHGELQNHTYRAGSFGNAQRGWKNDKNKYIPTPIILFSDVFDKNTISLYDDTFIKENLPYLNGISQENRLNAYRIGHITHEIGHHWFQWIIEQDMELLDEWKKILSSQKKPITPYAGEYIGNFEKFINESFAEFFRVLFTNEDYFNEIGLGDTFIQFVQKSADKLP